MPRIKAVGKVNTRIHERKLSGRNGLREVDKPFFEAAIFN
jgi:hypothetical protein